MSRAWLVVLIVGLATMAIKAMGPVFLGGKPLPERVQAVVGLLAPALLAALVVTSVFASGRDLVLDERLIGIAAAVLALVIRAPILVVVIVAAAATALARATG
jgi:branched-subunit amino acid transport protein